MPGSYSRVYIQPLLVESNSTSDDKCLQLTDSGGQPSFRQLDPRISGHPNLALRGENQIVRTAFSSVPTVRQLELQHGYQELGEALSQLTELEEGEDWKIDTPVYDAARYVAMELMASSIPVPRVFSHGSKSVVFNWERETRNLYLTISADRLSALISSPERIERRVEVDYSAKEFQNPSLLVSSIQVVQFEQPILLLVTNAVSEPPELVG